MHLPDFDGRIYFRLLAAVAAVDGHVGPQELTKLRELLTLAGSDPRIASELVHEAELRRTAPLWFLEGAALSPEFAALCLRDCLTLTCVDGWYSPSERALLADAATLIGAHDLLEGLPERAQAMQHQEPPPLPSAGPAALDEGLRALSGWGAPGGTFYGSVYFRLLAAVAAADGEVRPDEVERFARLIELAGGDAVLARPLAQEAVMRRREPLWFLDQESLDSPLFARTCLQDGVLVARSDGGIAAEERELLREAAFRLGIHDLDWLGAEEPTGPDTSEPIEPVRPSSSGVQQVDRALAAASGAAVLAGGTYIIAGGTAAKIAAGVAAVAGTGAVGLVVPMLLLLGAGVAGTALQIAAVFSDRDEHR
jgi:tellurite resistance protein